MIHATNTALCERPEAFDGVGVAIPAHVNLLGVVNPFVLVSRFAEKVINAIRVRVDRRRWHHTFENMRSEGVSLDVINRHGNDFTATLHHSEHRRVMRVFAGASYCASLTSASLSANVALVHFDRSVGIEGFKIFGHEFMPDFVSDSPRGLVGHAKLALQLLRGNPATSACHEVHRVEPKVKRSRRLVKDRSGCRSDVFAARDTSPSLSLLLVFVTLKLALVAALGAMRVCSIFRVAIAPKEIQTGVASGNSRMNSISEYLDSEDFARFGCFRFTGGIVRACYTNSLIQSRDTYH